MRKLKVHAKLRGKLDRNDAVELVGYVAASDPAGVTELWTTLNGEERMLVSTSEIMDAQEDEEGLTTLLVKGSSIINMVRTSRETFFAMNLPAGVQGSLGPAQSYKIGEDQYGNEIWIHIGRGGGTWKPPTFGQSWY